MEQFIRVKRSDFLIQSLGGVTSMWTDEKEEKVSLQYAVFDHGSYEFDMSRVEYPPMTSSHQDASCRLDWGDQDSVPFTFDESAVIGDGSDRQESGPGVEYILLAMLGCVVAMFLLCQLVVFCKGCVSRRETWQLGRRRWWNIGRGSRTTSPSGQNLQPSSSSLGSSLDTVWAYHYDPGQVQTAKDNGIRAETSCKRYNAVAGASPNSSSSSASREFPWEVTKDFSSTTVFVVDPHEPYHSTLSSSSDVTVERFQKKRIYRFQSGRPATGCSRTGTSSSSSSSSHRALSWQTGAAGAKHSPVAAENSTNELNTRSPKRKSKLAVSRTVQGLGLSPQNTGAREAEATSAANITGNDRILCQYDLSRTGSSSTSSSQNQSTVTAVMRPGIRRHSLHDVSDSRHTASAASSGSAHPGRRSSDGSLTSVSSMLSPVLQYRAMRKYSNPIGRRPDMKKTVNKQ